jgi:hypothetical protein
LALILSGCSSPDETDPTQLKLRNQKGEYIFRQNDELLFPIGQPEIAPPLTYPWNAQPNENFNKITKEYFRCKGSPLNSPYTVQKNDESLRVFDCGGSRKHSLPIREGKEFVYPILLELVNYIQEKTGKKVVITCGHRCPEHNAYADPDPNSQYSKHMIGAEAAFYVQGMEDSPDTIVGIIREFYKTNPLYKDKKDYTEFKRYEKPNTNTIAKPWYNKEVFIKIYKSNEGRNHDNRHPYPYITVQVRHDRDLNETVTYSWDKAFRNFHRW